MINLSTRNGQVDILGGVSNQLNKNLEISLDILFCQYKDKSKISKDFLEDSDFLAFQDVIFKIFIKDGTNQFNIEFKLSIDLVKILSISDDLFKAKLKKIISDYNSKEIYLLDYIKTEILNELEPKVLIDFNKNIFKLYPFWIKVHYVESRFNDNDIVWFIAK